jgi:replicative DNA helicase
MSDVDETLNAAFEALCAPETEEGVLGLLIGGGAARRDDLLSRLKPEHFVKVSHRGLFEELRAAVDAGRPIGMIEFTEWLREREKLDQLGGPSRVAELFLQGDQCSNDIGFFFEVLQDRLARRLVIQACEAAKLKALNLQVTWQEAMNAADAEMELNGLASSVNQAVPMKDVIVEVINDLEEAIRHRGRVRGVRTGITDLDRTINGLEAPDLFVIGGRPGMGKTNVVLRIMENVAMNMTEAGVPVLFFSVEMGRVQIGRRCMFSTAGVEQSKGKTGFLSRGDQDSVMTSATQWSEAKLWIDDSPDLTIADVRARIRQAVRMWGIKVVMLDYIQLIGSVTRAGQADERVKINEVMAGLKSVAKQCDVLIVALAQAGRGSEDNPGKRPSMRDFDGSSAIEKWADYAAFIHRPCKFIPWERLKEAQQDYYGSEEVYLEAAELLLVKNRHGSEAVVPLRFVGPLSRFENVTEKLYSNNDSKRQKGYKGGDGTGKRETLDDVFGQD